MIFYLVLFILPYFDIVFGITAVAGHSTQIWRDQFYDGHMKYEKGAVVARVSPSFVRFGTFELVYRRYKT